MLLATRNVLTVGSHFFRGDPVVELLFGTDVLPQDVTTDVVRKLTNVVSGVLKKRERRRKSKVSTGRPNE